VAARYGIQPDEVLESRPLAPSSPLALIRARFETAASFTASVLSLS